MRMQNPLGNGHRIGMGAGWLGRTRILAQQVASQNTGMYRRGFSQARESETAMIIGTHSIIYSTAPEADRAFLRDVLGLPHVDVGDGWLIFGLPPAEVAVHPSDENDRHEFYLMCDDVEALVADLNKRNITCGPVQNQGWGMLTQLTLPGGGKLGVYQPRHARPEQMDTRKSVQKSAERPAKKPTKPTSQAAQRKSAKSR
jgi:hypothetical protein